MFITYNNKLQLFDICYKLSDYVFKLKFTTNYLQLIHT